jgi:hypothetical protein
MKKELRERMSLLCSKSLCPISSWSAWLMLWESADTMEILKGLLHCGFDVPLLHPVSQKTTPAGDRVRFYLMVAEGWTGWPKLSSSVDGVDLPLYSYGGKNVGISGLRQIVAKKAFEVLCQGFFKKQNGLSRESQDLFFEAIVSDDRLFGALKHFFRCSCGSIGDHIIMNLANRNRFTFLVSHNEELAISFLLGLANFLWTRSPLNQSGGQESASYEDKMRQSLEKARPWMVDVLSYLGELEGFFQPKILLKLDQPCLNKLRDIALRSNLSLSPLSYRKVENIEEACLAGSPAARLLVLYETMRKIALSITVPA